MLINQSQVYEVLLGDGNWYRASLGSFKFDTMEEVFWFVSLDEPDSLIVGQFHGLQATKEYSREQS